MLIECAWNLQRHVPHWLFNPARHGAVCFQLSATELSHPENLFGVVSVLGDIHWKGKGPYYPQKRIIHFSKESLYDKDMSSDLCGS
ncbi:hypothetical protein CDAR_213301 [Caerostris darwini]|uniref:Uncharacterized protein n=1 Tax=Caerostris darwini TaxID=1538125 RepID=A0AAV4PZB2_9ARAC|nr:hypothetical protein CDAR_213301 [Caerostris darwini]